MSGSSGDGAGRKQPDELREVSLLGPADVAERVVEASLLVAGVVAARPVSPRVPEIDLAVEEVLRVDVELARSRRCTTRPWRRVISIDELMISDESELAHTIVASTPCFPGEVEDLGASTPDRCGSTTKRRAGLPGQLVCSWVHVDADDDAAGGERDARAELAHEPEPVDRDDLAELQVGPAQRLDRDPADGDERGVAQVDVVGDGNDVVDRRGRDLRVAGRRRTRRSGRPGIPPRSRRTRARCRHRCTRSRGA